MRRASVVNSPLHLALLAPLVEGIVDGHLNLQKPLVVGYGSRKPFGYSPQPRRLGRGVFILSDIGAVHDLGEARERRVFAKAIFFDEHLEGALTIPVRISRFGRIEGVCSLPFGDLQYRLWGYVEYLAFRIYKVPYQPGTGYAVRLRTRPGHPLHTRLLHPIRGPFTWATLTAGSTPSPGPHPPAPSVVSFVVLQRYKGPIYLMVPVGAVLAMAWTLL